MNRHSHPPANLHGAATMVVQSPPAVWRGGEQMPNTAQQQQQHHHYHHHYQEHHLGQSHASPSTSTQQQAALATREWDVQKVLHLYMHDYCLKQNYVKAANALALDTGMRTDEGVPFGAGAPDGLLAQWFSAFWASYTASNRLMPVGQLPSHDAPAHPSPTQAQQASHMWRIETEPLRKSSSVSDLGSAWGSSVVPFHGGGSANPSPYEMRAGMECRDDRISSGSETGHSIQQQNDHQQMPMTRISSQDAAAVMQKLGWGGRTIDTLSGEEKGKLASALKRSQLAQQQALERMAQSHYGKPFDDGSQRGPNGSAFQQMASSPQQQQHHQAQLYLQQSSPDQHPAASPQQQTTGPGKKSPSIRKKRRSSINMQAISQLQQQMAVNGAQSVSSSSSNNSNGPLMNKNGVPPSSTLGLGLAPAPMMVSTSPAPSTSFSPADAARGLEEHQIMARKLQVQSQGLIGQQQTSTPMSKSRSSGSRTSAGSSSGNVDAQQAQLEATSHATTQVNAQIAQMQHQLARQSAGRSGTQLSATQISQLKVLQGKLNNTMRATETGEWGKQQQPVRQHHSVGDMGPPPSPSLAGFGFGLTPIATKSNSSPSTPAMMTSLSLQNMQMPPEHLREGAAGAHEAPGIPLRQPFEYSPVNLATLPLDGSSSEGKLQGTRPPQETFFNHQALRHPLSTDPSLVGSSSAFQDQNFANFNWASMNSSS